MHSVGAYIKFILKVKRSFCVWQLPHLETILLNLICGYSTPCLLKTGKTRLHISFIFSSACLKSHLSNNFFFLSKSFISFTVILINDSSLSIEFLFPLKTFNLKLRPKTPVRRRPPPRPSFRHRTPHPYHHVGK